ncbi:hypothetical protein F5Y14DRAFT_234921 [Nemania sp. NC0429]|nr:hypothetical protein F5Y14DRAFT_234921 [Nemania sp. NC0429]
MTPVFHVFFFPCQAFCLVGNSIHVQQQQQQQCAACAVSNPPAPRKSVHRDASDKVSRRGANRVVGSMRAESQQAKELGTIDTVTSWPASFLPFPAEGNAWRGLGMGRGRVGCAVLARAPRVTFHQWTGEQLCFMGWVDGRNGRMGRWTKCVWIKLRSSVVTWVVSWSVGS